MNVHTKNQNIRTENATRNFVGFSVGNSSDMFMDRIEVGVCSNEGSKEDVVSTTSALFGGVLLSLPLGSRLALGIY